MIYMKNYLMNNENKRNNELDFFDDAFGGFFKPLFYEEKHHSMKTDIKETENSYVLDIEVPGFDKKDVNVSLENGYLTVSAQKRTCEGGENGEKDKKKENYIRRERSCSVSRSYYVGDVDKEAVKAKYENGVLTIDIPKEKPALPESHSIVID